MLNSSNYVKEVGVLQSGSQFGPDVSLEVLKDPNTKVYKHPAVGSRFIMPDGAELIFSGGVFITNNLDIIRELDKVANKRGTQITTDEKALQRLRGEIQLAADDAARPASEGNIVDGKAVVLEHTGGVVPPVVAAPLI